MPEFQYEGETIRFVGNYKSRSYDCLNRGRFYEQPFLEQVRALSLTGIYLDIGSNYGNHAIYFAKFCQCTQVIGFEPVPRFRTRALQNIQANNLQDKITVMDIGLSDKQGLVPFDQAGEGTLLKCSTLDQLFPDLCGVSFIKMDIEGHEPQAMLGARSFLRRNRPVIAAEVLGEPDKLIETANSLGYIHSGRIFTSTPSSPMYEFVIAKPQ